MTSLAPRSPATSQSPSKSVALQSMSPSDDLPSLQATLADLQAKRLGAIQLYQEEKAKRIAEAARTAELFARIDSPAAMSQPSSKHASATDQPAPVITTDFFIAEVCSLGLARGGPSASLTWHCLAMTDLMTSPPKIVLVADPKASPDSLNVIERSSPESTRNRHPPYAEQTSNEAETNAMPQRLAALTERLKQAEAAALEAKKTQKQNELLIADLKAQLDASTSACRDLLETVKEQEDTIERLS